MNEWEEKLRQIKLHPDFPFTKFRSDESQYMLLELFWAYLFKAVVEGRGRGLWRPWQEPDRDREGNPIFSAVDLNSGRGVQIIQHPGPDDPDVKLWGYFHFQPYLSHAFMEVSGSEVPILGFYFLADISEESEAYSRKFLKLFCVDGFSESEIDAEINRYCSSVGLRNPEVEPE
jgi:hypothetical protein